MKKDKNGIPIKCENCEFWHNKHKKCILCAVKSKCVNFNKFRPNSEALCATIAELQEENEQWRNAFNERTPQQAKEAFDSLYYKLLELRNCEESKKIETIAEIINNLDITKLVKPL